MDHIAPQLQNIEQNMRLNTSDPIARFGFTQLPNFLCFPGQERLAEHMGTHVSTVSRAITELEECSLIEIERRGQGRTNYYTINFVVKKKGKP